MISKIYAMPQMKEVIAKAVMCAVAMTTNRTQKYHSASNYKSPKSCRNRLINTGLGKL
jgi:hypothetical protein